MVNPGVRSRVKGLGLVDEKANVTACAQIPRTQKPDPRPLTPQEKQINETQKRAKAAVESNYDGIFGAPKYKTPETDSTRPQ